MELTVERDIQSEQHIQARTKGREHVFWSWHSLYGSQFFLSLSMYNGETNIM